MRGNQVIMISYDVVVIGGGLLGCFALRSLMRYDVNAALFEGREDLCTGISRANTAIVYSGCDTKPGTLKTEMCVRSAQHMGELCRELGVRYSRCGSLMVSFGPRGDSSLRRKYELGLANGVREIRLLSGRETLEIEPGLAENVTLALYVRDTGTVNPWELCLAAAESAIANGAHLRLKTEVTGVKEMQGGYCVTAGGADYFTCGIINCAGQNADTVHEMAAEPIVRIIPSEGDYLVLDTKVLGAINHIIFHEPEERAKGLTLVPTIDGNILVGPTERDFCGEEHFASSREGMEVLHNLAAQVVPSLPMEHVIRGFGTMRPNPFHVLRDERGKYTLSDRSINDFCIICPEEVPRLISLIGIKTPGLTCSNELGLRASDMMAGMLGLAGRKGFRRQPKAPVRVNKLSFEERSELVRKNPAYGRIVCRCREISEGEIVDAVRRCPGAVTIDGVKRRTCATSGRCQGSFCTQRIIEIIANETGRLPENIEKDATGSYIIKGGSDGI